VGNSEEMKHTKSIKIQLGLLLRRKADVKNRSYLRLPTCQETEEVPRFLVRQNLVLFFCRPPRIQVQNVHRLGSVQRFYLLCYNPLSKYRQSPWLQIHLVDREYPPDLEDHKSLNERQHLLFQ